ncbi:CgeB family protein [Tunturiibacter gelidoferens]|uniref:Glycosyltransferase n=1 Tax=Tunturiibacter gelidiferens TaxID=3069689 RepID=A0AAU7YY05_9BACT
MKILYATGLSPNDTSLYRLWALERLGHQVIPFNVFDYESNNPILRKVNQRLVIGPSVARLNRELIEIAQAEKPDLLWTDKLLYIRPATLDRMRAMDIVTVSYMIDNPFGTRQDPGWRIYMKDIPHYDLHVVQRDKNILDYKLRGARDVIKIQTAYEPTLQFPPPQGWSDADRNREVSFIGTPYDDRAQTLTRLWRECGFPVVISGNPRQWGRAMEPSAYKALFNGGELFRDEYREGIWKSKINLSFITHSNCDEFVHKSFEIAGCGGFLLAERSDGHMQRFKEDEEAVFFTGFEELAAKIRRYLPDEAARQRIAAAGCIRAARDGYYNDRQVELIVERAQSILEKIKGKIKPSAKTAHAGSR